VRSIKSGGVGKLRESVLGKACLAGKKQYKFVKKRNGYVVLVESNNKFHFSRLYGYSFLTIVNPVREMKPFSNQVAYPSHSLMFILTDDDEGIISDMSETCKQIVGLQLETLSNQDLVIDRPFVRICDLLVDFNWANFKLQRKVLAADKSSEPYENIHKFNLGLIRSNHYYDEGAGEKDNAIMMRVRIFEEYFEADKQRMNIFILKTVDDLANPTIHNKRDLAGVD